MNDYKHSEIEYYSRIQKERLPRTALFSFIFDFGYSVIKYSHKQINAFLCQSVTPGKRLFKIRH